MMIFLIIGRVLLILGLLGAIAELAVHIMVPSSGLYISGYDVGYVLAPGPLALMQIWIESHLGGAVWNEIVRPALALPLWASFGVPGLIVLWKFRAYGSDAHDAQNQEEALALYDALARAAREDGYGEGDDMSPCHGGDAFADDQDNLNSSQALSHSRAETVHEPGNGENDQISKRTPEPPPDPQEGL